LLGEVRVRGRPSRHTAETSKKPFKNKRILCFRIEEREKANSRHEGKSGKYSTKTGPEELRKLLGKGEKKEKRVRQAKGGKWMEGY